MNVVIVDGDLSYPPTSGKRLRTLHLMQRHARRHHVTYICRSNGRPDEEREAYTYLADQGIEVVFVPHLLPTKSGPMFFGRLAANLLSPMPYSIVSHASPKIEEAIAAHAARSRVDLWQFEWMPYATALKNSAGVPRVLIAHNVDSLIWQRYHENELNPLKRWYIRKQWQKLERFERRAYPEFTRVVAVSPEDAALLRNRFGVKQVSVVENGIDRAYFDAVHPCQGTHRILFLGSLDYRPNVDAVDLLLKRVFPAVLKQEPAARLLIVGRRPSPSLIRRAGAVPNVEVHADVADVRPFLASSSVMTVPLRIGGGSRLKILEALACGLPVVSTRVGAEGLCLTPGRHLDVVDDVEQMASALVDCLRSPERALQMAEQGRRVVQERYDWDSLADKLERIWEECVAPRKVLALEGSPS